MTRAKRRNPTALRRSALALAAAALICALLVPTFAGAASQSNRYASTPGLSAPKFVVHGKFRGNGYVMVANFRNLQAPGGLAGSPSPMIFDKKMRPVWIGPRAPSGQDSLNLQSQVYRGKRVLTYWNGAISNTGHVSSGVDYVYDSSYRRIARIDGTKDGWILSPHEFLLTRRGTALVTGYRDLPNQDLSAYGGPSNGIFEDVGVLEYDVATGKLLYTWSAMDPGHVSPRESYSPPPKQASVPWDPYHLNSIAEDGAGHLMISMRNTYGIYEIDKATGQIVWRLGGKQSSFAMGPKANFAFQHDARYLKGNQISLFDDDCCGFGPPKTAGGPPTALPPVYGPSRGLILKLDYAHMTASLAHQYPHTGLISGSQGNMQVLGNGDVVVGWGNQPFISEFNAAGKRLFDARWPGANESYRAMFQPWRGTPRTRPSVAVRRGRTTTLYVSWNGATQVAAWRVLSGSSPKHLKVAVGKVGRRNFETAIRVANAGKVLEVQALDGRGHAIGSKLIIPRHPKRGSKNPPPSGLY